MNCLKTHLINVCIWHMRFHLQTAEDYIPTHTKWTWLQTNAYHFFQTWFAEYLKYIHVEKLGKVQRSTFKLQNATHSIRSIRSCFVCNVLGMRGNADEGIEAGGWLLARPLIPLPFLVHSGCLVGLLQLWSLSFFTNAFYTLHSQPEKKEELGKLPRPSFDILSKYFLKDFASRLRNDIRRDVFNHKVMLIWVRGLSDYGSGIISDVDAVTLKRGCIKIRALFLEQISSSYSQTFISLNPRFKPL